MRVQNAAVKPFDVSRLEDEVRDVVLQKQPHIQAVDYAPRNGAPPVPEYVSHREDVTEIGKLSAEAVVREYEATAKEIESMGTELLERVKECEAMTRDALAVTTELKAVAARYREEAKRVFEHIESCSLVVAEARKACTDLKDKISVSMAADKLKPKKK